MYLYIYNPKSWHVYAIKSRLDSTSTYLCVIELCNPITVDHASLSTIYHTSKAFTCLNTVQTFIFISQIYLALVMQTSIMNNLLRRTKVGGKFLLWYKRNFKLKLTEIFFTPLMSSFLFSYLQLTSKITKHFIARWICNRSLIIPQCEV